MLHTCINYTYYHTHVYGYLQLTYVSILLQSYDLIDLARGYGGYGGNVGDEWDCVDYSSGDLTPNACFASGW